MDDAQSVVIGGGQRQFILRPVSRCADRLVGGAQKSEWGEPPLHRPCPQPVTTAGAYYTKQSDTVLAQLFYDRASITRTGACPYFKGRTFAGSAFE